MSFWENRRVLVTGGGGFLGRHLVQRLERERPAGIAAPRARDYDLRRQEDVARCLRDNRPQVVIHAAAAVGGVGATRTHPGKFFYDNAAMGIELIEQSRLQGVEKLVCLGTICAYPAETPVPFREEDLWNGYPRSPTRRTGSPKKMLLVQLQAYRQEYGFRGIYLLPVNLYGPGDNFDPESSHVIPALIRKFREAQEAAAPRSSSGATAPRHGSSSRARRGRRHPARRGAPTAASRSASARGSRSRSASSPRRSPG